MNKNLVITITQPQEDSQQYMLQVTSPKGKGASFFRLPENLTGTALKDMLKNFRTNVSTNRYLMRGTEDNVLTPRKFGSTLFNLVFTEKIAPLYHASLEEAQYNGRNLPLRLNMPRTLAKLPWEFLFDPQETMDTGYLCFGEETPIIRFFDSKLREPTFDPPLRLLLVSANSNSKALLDLDKEQAAIAKSAKPLKKIKIERLFDATVENLADTIRTFKPHIVHFMGHGGVQHLAMKDGTISNQSLAITLRNDKSLRLVVLNACEAGGVAEGDISTKIRVGVARSLAQSGVPAVVAMQFPISDRAAITFAGEFYKILLGEEEIHSVDGAVTYARTAIQRNLPHGTLEWATPVLYMQTPDGRLFDDLLKPKQTKAKPVIPGKEERVEKIQSAPKSRDAHLKNLIAEKTRRLQKLQQQKAQFGIDARPHILTEIEDIEAEMEQLQDELANATKKKTVESKPDSMPEGAPPGEHIATEPAEDVKINLDIYYQEGTSYFDQEDWITAIGFLEKVSALDDTYRDTKKLLATARDKLEEQQKYRQSQRQAEILLGQAQQYIQGEQWEEALDLLQIIKANDPAFKTDEVEQLIVQSRSNYKKAITKNFHQLQLQTLYQHAQSALQQKEWVRAIYVLEELERQASGEYEDSTELIQKARRQKSLKELYDQGIKAFEDKDWDKTVAHFGQIQAWDENYEDVNQKLAIARKEQNLDAHYQEGLDFLNAGLWQEALDAFSIIQDDDVARNEARLARRYAQSQIHINNEEWTETVKLLPELTAAGYRDSSELLKRARLEQKWAEAFAKGKQALAQKEWDKAISAFKIITKEAKDYKDGRATELLDKAELQAKLSRLYNQAKRQLDQKHWHNAIEPLEKIQALCVEHQLSYEDAATLLKNARKEAKCLDLYNRARGESVGRREAAISTLEELLQFNPEYRDARKLLKEAYCEKKSWDQYTKAERAYENGEWEKTVVLLEQIEPADYLDKAKYLKIAKRQVKLKQLYNEGKRRLKEKDWDKAVMVLNELLPQLKLQDEHLDKAYADTPALLKEAEKQQYLAEHYQKARGAMSLKDWDAAITEFQKVIAKGPDYKEAASSLKIAKTERDFETAYIAAQKAYEAKNWTTAIKHLSKALEYKPYHPEAAAMKQRAERQQGIKEALEAGAKYESEQKWGDAAAVYRRITEKLDRLHPEALDRLNKAERQQKLRELMDLANQQIKAENWEQAIQTLKEVFLIDKTYENVSRKLLTAKNEDRLKKLYQQAQQNLAEGQKTYNREKLESAIELFTRIHREKPDGYEDTATSLSAAQKVLQILDNYTLAMRLFKAKSWEESAVKFQEVIDQQQDYRDAVEYLNKTGINQTHKDHWSKAEALLQHSEPSTDDLLRAKKELEQIIENEESDYAEDAKKEFHNLNDKLEQRLQNYYEQMDELASQGKWGLAHNILNEIVKIDANGNASEILRQKMDEAIERYQDQEDFDKALKIDDLMTKYFEE